MTRKMGISFCGRSTTFFSLVLIAVWAFWFVFPQPGYASSQFAMEPKAVFTGPEAAPWERVELLEDRHPDMKTELFASGGEHKEPLIKKWFASATPPSNSFLLHCAKGFSAARTLPNPILLVHGAADNANRGWANPFHQNLPGPIAPEFWGMSQWMADLGYPVFAITFAHPNGCNVMQAEQVANAIARIRHLLRRENDPTFKVDVIAHSKGNLAVRLYCSDAPKVFPDRKFLTPYRHDVRTYVAIGCPMQGIDSPFRYYGFNILRATAKEFQGASPIAVESMLLNGQWKNFADENYTGGGNLLWPGQAQCLFNLERDGDIPFGMDSATIADGNLSMRALYDGGKTLFLNSQGIDKAIARGERFMYRLEERGIEPDVELLVIAGDDALINEPGVPSPKRELFLISSLFQVMLSQTSDGAVFLKTATNVTGILKRGAKHLETKVFHMNHIDIARHKKVIQFIDTFLLRK
ncbi:MAG: hypothetical protein WA705_25160 [Candidatus Ozemobacteraceae bacterium]